MTNHTDVPAGRHPAAAFLLWLATALAMTVWFFVALIGAVVSTNGGTQLLVAALGIATAYAAGETRTFWPDAVRTRRLLLTAVAVLFIVWLVVAQGL